MAILGPKFKDLTMKTENMECKVGFSRFNGHFRMAQIWLDRMLMDKMQPYIPKKTGEFQRKINLANAGKWGTGEIVTAVPPQGRYLYPGIAPSGRPFRWTNPSTQPRWGTYTYNLYKKQFTDGIAHVVAKGEYPRG